MTLLLDPSWPPSEALCRDPILAILAALDATATIACRALLTVHPHAADDERPYWVKPPLSHSDRVAPDIVLIVNRLHAALESYRNAIALELRDAPAPDPSSDDFPF